MPSDRRLLFARLLFARLLFATRHPWITNGLPVLCRISLHLSTHGDAAAGVATFPNPGWSYRRHAVTGDATGRRAGAPTGSAHCRRRPHREATIPTETNSTTRSTALDEAQDADRDGPDAAAVTVHDAGAPFDLLKSLTCLDLLGTHVASDFIRTTQLRIPIEVDERALLLELSQTGTPSRPEITARRLDGPPAAGAAQVADHTVIGRRLEHLLGASDALAGFYELAREDASFWRTAQTLEGLHRVGFATPFEGICWTILRQRQYPNVATARLRRLRARFGPVVEHEGVEHCAFPAASTIAGAALEAIRKEVKSRKKARYLREAAVAFAAMGDDFDVLNDPPDELEDRLRAIRGVGPWSARTLLANAFCRPHLTHVVTDGQLSGYWRDVLERFYGPGIDAAWARERADHYGAWESYWLFYARFTHLAMKRAASAAVVDA